MYVCSHAQPPLLRWARVWDLCGWSISVKYNRNYLHSGSLNVLSLPRQRGSHALSVPFRKQFGTFKGSEPIEELLPHTDWLVIGFVVLFLLFLLIPFRLLMCNNHRLSQIRSVLVLHSADVQPGCGPGRVHVLRSVCSQPNLAAEESEERLHLCLGWPVGSFADSLPTFTTFNAPV